MAVFPNGLLTTTDGTWDNSPDTFTYSWYNNGTIIGGANAQTYVPTVDDIGANISSEVAAANTFGETTEPSSTSLTPVDQRRPAVIAAPLITGVAVFPDGLLSTTGGTWDHSPTGFAYRWYKDGSAIAGANAATYVPLEADIGANISSEVDAANAFGPTTAASSNGPAIADERLPALVTAPFVSGTTAFPDGLLSTTNGAWNHNPTTFAYRWYKDGSLISGASSQTYATIETDIGAAISAEVDASNAFGPTTAASSNSPTIADERLPVSTLAPVISGVAKFPNGLLSTDNGAWDHSPSTFAYRWYRDFTLIGGATAQTYIPVAGDLGGVISSDVTASNAFGATTATSSNGLVATASVTAPDPVTGLTAAAGNAQVDLSWVAPVNDGGSPIDDYIIEYKLDGDVVWIDWPHLGASTTETVAGLVNDSLYNFRVAASNNDLDSTFTELNSTPIGSGVTPPIGSGPHLYWRVMCLDTVNDGYVGAGEIEFMDTVGGPTITAGETVIFGSERSTFPATMAFDGITTGTNCWSTEKSNLGTTAWAGIQFAVPVEIVEVAITPRNDQYFTQGPSWFDVEYSDDGVTWVKAFGNLTYAVFTQGSRIIASVNDVLPTSGIVGFGGNVIKVNHRSSSISADIGIGRDFTGREVWVVVGNMKNNNTGAMIAAIDSVTCNGVAMTEVAAIAGGSDNNSMPVGFFKLAGVVGEVATIQANFTNDGVAGDQLHSGLVAFTSYPTNTLIDFVSATGAQAPSGFPAEQDLLSTPSAQWEAYACLVQNGNAGSRAGYETTTTLDIGSDEFLTVAFNSPAVGGTITTGVHSGASSGSNKIETYVAISMG